MGMSVGGGGDDELNSTINTTPLVDIMLVVLIIFLITVPVVIKTIPVELPKATNVPTQTKPENIVIAVSKDGDIFWNDAKLPDSNALFEKLKGVAVLQPQPEVHIRGDLSGRYEYVGRVMYNCQRANIRKIGFITEPVRGG
jgi:biopolymer transport protein ExbD